MLQFHHRPESKCVVWMLDAECRTLLPREAEDAAQWWGGSTGSSR